MMYIFVYGLHEDIYMYTYLFINIYIYIHIYTYIYIQISIMCVRFPSSRSGFLGNHLLLVFNVCSTSVGDQMDFWREFHQGWGVY